jgi:hypothetical protein
VQANTKRLMYQLMAINILIIIMDLVLLGLECASLYILETVTKPVFYSIKLKLEFAILGKLVLFVGGSRSGHRAAPVSFSDIETSVRPKKKNCRPQQRTRSRWRDEEEGENNCSDWANMKTNATGMSQSPRKSTLGKADPYEIDIDEQLSRMEHIENLSSNGPGQPNEVRAPRKEG